MTTTKYFLTETPQLSTQDIRDVLAAAQDQSAHREALREAADFLARTEAADAVTTAMNTYQGSLQLLAKDGGPDPATVSRLANGRSAKGGTVATLAQIALAMNKTLKIVIE